MVGFLKSGCNSSIFLKSLRIRVLVIELAFRNRVKDDRVFEIRVQMRTIVSFSYLSRSDFYGFPSSSSSFSYFSSLASPAKTSNSNPVIVDYLMEACGFSKIQALSASKRFWWAKNTKKPESVVSFLQQLGFSETHIRDAVRVSPQILFADVDKTLKPKLQLFQQLGLAGSDLGRFISKNASLLTASLERKLIPCMEILKKILSHSGGHRGLIQVVQRCNWVISIYPELRLLPNISLLESYGIVGTQLSILLRRQPILFVMREPALRDLVSKVVEMGFSADSRMLVHALYTVSCMSSDTLRRKFELFQSFGFLEEEYMTMFRRAPGLLRTSENKLKLGLEVFINTIGFEREVLVRRPTCLMHSIERRVIPRYKVIEILKSKRLLKKDPSFIQVVQLSEDKFLEKFLTRFNDYAEELLIAYKGDVSDSSDE